MKTIRMSFTDGDTMCLWRPLVVVLILFFLSTKIFANEIDILTEKSIPALEKIANDKNTSDVDLRVLVFQLEKLGKENPEAIVLLGDLYLSNRLIVGNQNTPSNDVQKNKAISLYTSVVKRSVRANLRLAKLFSNQPQKEMSFVLEAASLGDETSQKHLEDALNKGFIFIDDSLQNRAKFICKKKEISENTSSWFKNILPAFTTTAQKDEFLFLIAIKFALLGIVGVIVSICKKIYLFYEPISKVLAFDC